MQNIIEEIRKEIKIQDENGEINNHTDGPGYNDSSGSDDFENWSNNG